MNLRKRARKLLRWLPVRTRENAAAEKLPRKPFPGSRTYWEERYAIGGNSGVGSYSEFAKFKAEVLNAFVEANNVDTIIEFGCGDGNQLKLANYAKYMGFDVSSTAISLCRNTFEGDNNKLFCLLDFYAGEKAELALSLDVVYHLIEDNNFEEHMRILFNSATQFVIIYSSDTDNNDHNDQHVRHRTFTRWIEANAVGWSLDRHVANKYPYVGDYKQGSFADFYIYKKTASYDRPATLERGSS